MPPKDDIESFWDGIRPPREPVPEPKRRVHLHSARFREGFQGTDEQWDTRARDLIEAGLLSDPRSFTMDEIREDCEDRARLLSEWRPAEDQRLGAPRYSTADIRSPEWVRLIREELERSGMPVTDQRVEQIQNQLEYSDYLGAFSEDDIGAQQSVAQVLREELAQAAQTPDAMSDEEEEEVIPFDELDSVVARLRATTGEERSEALQQLRRILTDNPSPELQRRRAEYARLARGAGLPERSITVDRAIPEEFDQTFSHSSGWPGAAIERLREQLRQGPFQRPSAPAEPRALRPGEGNNQSDRTENILSQLTEALTALGFPLQSITIERSMERQRLTLHMSPSYELETDSGPDEVSVTLTPRI